MLSVIDAWRRRLTLAAAVLALAAAPAAVAAQEGEEPPPPEASGTSAGAEAGEKGEEEGEEPKRFQRAFPRPYDPDFRVASPEPPDGEWLKDEEGREYFLMKYPKVEGRYRWTDEAETMVRLDFGITMPVDHHDDEFFYLRVYRPEPFESRPAGPTPEEEAAVAAAYRVELRESDRLRFVPFDQGLPKSGQWRNGFDLADMDGDGHLDFVAPPPRKSWLTPVIFLGDGAGNWRPWTAVRFPEAPYDYGDIAAADFNGDGAMDLALGMHIKGLLVLVGDGEGNFERWSQGLPIQRRGRLPKFSSRAIGVADFDADGRPDVLALSDGPRGPARGAEEVLLSVAIFLNRGDGTWEAGSARGQVDIFGDDVALGDFDGDGGVDFATASGVRGEDRLVHRAARAWNPEAIEPLRPRGVVWGVASADFDRDGRDDLALAYTTWELGVRRDAIDVLYARPREEGLAWERRVVAASDDWGTRYSAVAAGDLDGDGAADLVALTRDRRAAVFLGDGEGSFTREVAPELAADPQERCRGYALHLGDADGDGRDEIFAGFGGDDCPGGGTLRVWKAEEREAGPGGLEAGSRGTP